MSLLLEVSHAARLLRCISTCRVCTDEPFGRLYATSDTCKARTPSSLGNRQGCAPLFESCSVRATTVMPTTPPEIFCAFTQYLQKNSGILRLLGHVHSVLLLHQSVSQPTVVHYRCVHIRSPGRNGDWVLCDGAWHLWALRMTVASCRPSGTLDSEMTPRFFENLCLPGLYCRSGLLTSVGGAGCLSKISSSCGQTRRSIQKIKN